MELQIKKDESDLSNVDNAKKTVVVEVEKIKTVKAVPIDPRFAPDPTVLDEMGIQQYAAQKKKE